VQASFFFYCNIKERKYKKKVGTDSLLLLQRVFLRRIACSVFCSEHRKTGGLGQFSSAAHRFDKNIDNPGVSGYNADKKGRFDAFQKEKGVFLL
jgi:hypothetical protein